MPQYMQCHQQGFLEPTLVASLVALQLMSLYCAVHLSDVVDLLAAAGRKESDAERVSRFLPFSDGK